MAKKSMEKPRYSIMPAGPLMKEHRLIERMITLLKKETEKMESGSPPDAVFIRKAADFIKTYADKCHHGKEEDILFRELAKKGLSEEHSRIMSQLIAEHKYGRETLKALIEAEERFQKGEDKRKADTLTHMKALAEFYPRHIEKEDKHFFLPCMDYFSRKEKDAMLDEFLEFDKTLIHVKYGEMVKEMEPPKKR